MSFSVDLLALLNVRGFGPAKVNKLLLVPEAFARLSTNDSTLSTDQREQFETEQEKASEIIQSLEADGINFLAIFDNEYPTSLKQVLGNNAPPLLMYRGNKELFHKMSVGFCGSRKASEKGFDTAKDCADQLASNDVNVVSGYAAGVDMTTHRAALECNGTTTFVLAEGISHFRIKKDLADLWDWNRVLVVSEFLPGIPWSVRNAMQRNKTICALSGAVILIEAGETGGSIAAGKECLKTGLPLFAPVYEGMPESATGNRILLGQGAHEIYKSLKTGRAKVQAVYNEITQRYRSRDLIETSCSVKNCQPNLI